MEPVRLGIVGCGVMGNNHLGAAQRVPEVKVVAVADLRLDRAQEAAKKYGVPKVFCEGAELLDDPAVDAVVLALPTFGRPYLALRAFANGKHVLLEKPVAMNAGQVRQFIQARGPLAAGCCSSRNRFLASSKIVTDFIATGALGDLRVVRCRAIYAAGKAPDKEPPLWRESTSLNGGGILVNWGCYDLDYLLGLLSWTLKPRLVLAQAWPVAPHLAARAAKASDAEAHFSAMICCEGGAVITFERGEFMAQETDAAWQITGSKGALRLQMNAWSAKTFYHDDTTPADGVVSRVFWEGKDDYEDVRNGLLRDFAGAIREKRQPLTGLEQALVVQQITDAIYASAAPGRAVEVV